MWTPSPGRGLHADDEGTDIHRRASDALAVQAGNGELLGSHQMSNATPVTDCGGKQLRIGGGDQHRFRGGRHQFGNRSGGDQVAAVDDHRLVGAVGDLGEEVAGEEDSSSLVAEARSCWRMVAMPRGSRPLNGSSRTRTSG